MTYRVLADLVVVVHVAFVAFVVLGGLLVLWRRWIALVHLPAAAWGVWIEVAGGVCPLTPLENELRRRSGAAGYEGGFVEHYLLPVLYPAGLTARVQLVLALFVVAVNLVVYGFVVRRFATRKRS